MDPAQAASAQGHIPGQVSPEDEAKRVQEAQLRRDLLTTVLDTGARERLSRIALVSPERSRQIEGMLLGLAQSGQLRGRVTENQLIELLEKAEGASGKSSTNNIVYHRRKDLDDDFDI